MLLCDTYVLSASSQYFALWALQCERRRIAFSCFGRTGMWFFQWDFKYYF